MAEKGRAILYAFWQSSCSWRVRAVLNIKRVPYEERPVDIVKSKQQMTEEFRALNPAQKVPALHIGNLQNENVFSVIYGTLNRSKFPKDTILYGNWQSSCSWRVRAALYIKGVPFDERPVDTREARQQLTEQYRMLNPAQKVPVLVIDNVTLVESMAIIQYLDETRPEPPLSPREPLLRARVREICETVVSGIQPLQNTGLKPHFPTEEDFQKFTKHFSIRGLQTLEELLQKNSGKYCVGDQLTVADICLVPQLYNAVNRYGIDLSVYPKISKLYETLLNEKVFQESHPKNAKPNKF